MASSRDSHLQKIADLVLRMRLQEHEERLKMAKKEVEKEAARQNVPRGQAVRGLLVNAWSEALEKHCDQAVRELVGLMRTFDALSSAEMFRKKFEEHTDSAAAQLVQRLNSAGNSSSAAAEKNRITNVASRIKTRARQTLKEEVEKAEREREAGEILTSSGGEMDDRLPLYRRATFDRDLTEMLKAAKKNEVPLSLIMMDLDRFKSVNDTHGHPVGDEVLLVAAERAGRRLQGKGKAYRYGGEEFAILLPNYSAEEAVGLAERIRKDIEKTPMSSKKLKITGSFGIASAPDHAPANAKDAKVLLRRADDALYRAKEEGRNRVRSEE